MLTVSTLPSDEPAPLWCGHLGQPVLEPLERLAFDRAADFEQHID
jgi:hypothetical protein